MASEELLFSKEASVTLREYDQRRCFLQITIILQNLLPGHRKELYVRLTNSEDLMFLQTLSLTDDEFQSLKLQQGLLVDFSTFPQKFVDLLEMCISEQKNPVPRFLLSFTPGPSLSPPSPHGLLEIIETNPFKHLVHLSLKFMPGNDEEVKNYLASCLKNIKEEKNVITQKFTNTENDLSSRLSCTQQLLAESTKEVKALKLDVHTQIQEATNSIQKELQFEKKKCVEIQERLECKIENERLEHDARYVKTVEEFEERLKSTQSSNKELLDHKYRLESLVRDLKTRVSALQEEKHSTSKNVQHLRRQNNHLDSDRHERDKTLNHLRTRVAVLEQELKDKQQVIARTNELLETSNENKNRLEVDVENKMNQMHNLESTVSSVSAEVIKGNEIIQKLQNEMRSVKSKLKMMNMVTAKQEKVIEEKDSLIGQYDREISEKKNLITESQNELKHLKKEFGETTQKYNDTQETLKNNENVIAWLNKQLNEQTVSKLSSTYNSSSASHLHGNKIPYRPTATTTNIMTATESMTSFKNTGHFRHPLQAAGMMEIPKHVVHNQVPYRPILKKPQFRPDGISPITPGVRGPLRPKQQMSTPVIREETQDAPALDPKYLVGESTNAHLRLLNQQNDENTDPVTTTTTSASNPKRFVLSSAYFSGTT